MNEKPGLIPSLGAPPPLPSHEGRQAWTFNSPATGAQKSTAGPKAREEEWLIAIPGFGVNRARQGYFLSIVVSLSEVDPVETGAPGGEPGAAPGRLPAAAGGRAAAATLGAGLAAT
jgi:hypothetical protein